MRLLVRFLLVPIGIGAAITAGMFFLLLAVFLNSAVGELFAGLSFASLIAFFDWLTATGEPDAAGGGVLLALWALAVAVVVLPPAVVGLIGEVAGWRSFIWYSGGTGAISAALPWLARGSAEHATEGELSVTLALFLAGAFAGLIYWLVAGRTAGRAMQET
jgi:hypothetical protein